MVEELDCAIVNNHDEQYQIATKKKKEALGFS